MKSWVCFVGCRLLGGLFYFIAHTAHSSTPHSFLLLITTTPDALASYHTETDSLLSLRYLSEAELCLSTDFRTNE